MEAQESVQAHLDKIAQQSYANRDGFIAVKELPIMPLAECEYLLDSRTIEGPVRTKEFRVPKVDPITTANKDKSPSRHNFKGSPTRLQAASSGQKVV